MDRRRRSHGAPGPAGDEPAGWVAAGEERQGWVPHQRNGWQGAWSGGSDGPPAPAGHGPGRRPDEWYEPAGGHRPPGERDGPYDTYRESAEWYASSSGYPAEQYPPPDPREQYPQYPPDQYSREQYPPDQYSPDQYSPAQYSPAQYPTDQYRTDRYPQGQYPTPEQHPQAAYPYPQHPGPARPHPGSHPDPYPAAQRPPPHQSRHAASRPAPTPPAPEQRERPGPDWAPALLWTGIFFLVPALAYLGWALTLSGTVPADCVDVGGGPCPSPRTEAVAQFVGVLPALGGALVLALLTALGIRRLAADWRHPTIGFSAAVVGAGFATLVAAAFR